MACVQESRAELFLSYMWAACGAQFWGYHNTQILVNSSSNCRSSNAGIEGLCHYGPLKSSFPKAIYLCVSELRWHFPDDSPHVVIVECLICPARGIANMTASGKTFPETYLAKHIQILERKEWNESSSIFRVTHKSL